ncbi:MAG: transglutaminase-like domain-containing protein [Nitrospirae bacterium]|nr:transglutaminase-like domain-containing protein [Nitrospirota bacterium]
MDCEFSRALKIVSTVVLAFFLWSFGGLFEIVHALNTGSKFKVQGSTLKTGQTKTQKPEQTFEKDIEDIYQALSDTTTDTDTKKTKVKGKKNEIESLDGEIRKQFKETEKFLKEKGLPGEILNRHYDFVRHYEDNFNELRNNLDAIDKAKSKGEADAAIERAKAHLEKVKPPKTHVSLDPNKLPHRTAEPVFIEPRTSPEQFLNDRDTLRVTRNASKDSENLSHVTSHASRILIASNGPLKGLINEPQTPPFSSPYQGEAGRGGASSSVLVAQANPPTSADLAETIEVRFTPEISAKAQELQNNPVKIYNWVRNNIEYVPTYGSIQGANMCLQTKLCNDFDTASLLIALLRASGIHARYVYGTIEVPIEKVKNWLGGFADSMAAINLLASAGIPTKGMIDGGQVKYVQMEHMWVEAYINYFPSRGARHKNGLGDTWIRLDASFKQYNYTQGIDIKAAVPFDAQTFVDQVKNSATINEAQGYVTNVSSTLIQQGMQDYQTRVQNYISQNYPNATVGDVLGKKEIIKQEFSYLLGTLPYKTIVRGTTYSSIPDSLRHKLNFSVVKDILDNELGTPINITKSLPELAGKKITLSYSPATPQDEAAINSFLPNPHADGSPIQPNELPTLLPAYLVNLKPELRIDGVVVATGTTIGMGSSETFAMIFISPNGATDVIANDLRAGEYLSVALGLGRISHDQVLALKAKLESTKSKLDATNYAALTKEDIIGDLLYTVALSYHLELDVMDSIIAGAVGVRTLRLPSEAIFSLSLEVQEMFGIPFTVSQGGPIMDVDRVLSVSKAIDGDKEKELQFMFSTGMSGSALEHSIPEQILSTLSNPVEGVSAVKALQIANDQGIPIYTIDQTNISTVLPQLQVDSDIKIDIQNAVNAGKEVTVSKTNITFNGGVGCGYIVMDPNTGAGAYMISGKLGGARILNALKVLIINLYLIPSGKGFDEVGEAAGVIKEELSPICAYLIKYFECMAAQFAEDFNGLISSFVKVGWSLVGIASKKIAARVCGFIGYVMLVVGATTYFYNAGMKCK